MKSGVPDLLAGLVLTGSTLAAQYTLHTGTNNPATGTLRLIDLMLPFRTAHDSMAIHIIKYC